MTPDGTSMDSVSVVGHIADRQRAAPGVPSAMDWSHVAPITAFVPRGIGSAIAYDGTLGAPAHWDREANILNSRPSGQWPRLTVTVYDVSVVEGLAEGGKPAPLTGVDVRVLVSVSNPDPVWTDQTNESPLRLLGYAVGYLEAHPVKSWSLGQDGGGYLTIDWKVERIDLAPEVMNSFFVAARVPLMPAVAYRVHVEEPGPKAMKMPNPPDWGVASVALTGRGALAAAEAYAAANDRPLLWVDGAADARGLAALAADGNILAFAADALRSGKGFDVSALPAGSIVLTEDRALLAALTRSKVPTVER